MTAEIPMCSRSAFKGWAAVFALVLGVAGGAHALVANGDFTDGLNHWTHEHVDTMDGAARLSEDDGVYSWLYQWVPLQPGLYGFSFDYWEDLSGTTPQGAFPDFFASTLYFSEGPIAPGSPDDLFFGGQIAGAVPLVDMFRTNDELNTDNPFGVISPLGDGWFRYQITFQNTYAYILPTFELWDDNTVSGDSQVRIDNVRLAVIPEPATGLVFGAGLAALAWRRMRRR